MTQDDVLFGYRLQLFALASQTSVRHAATADAQRVLDDHRATDRRLRARSPWVGAAQNRR